MVVALSHFNQSLFSHKSYLQIITALQNQITIMKNLHFFRYLFIFLIIVQTACTPFIKINRDFEKPFAQQKPVEQPNKPRFAENFELNSKFGVIEEEIYRLLLRKDFDRIEKVTTKAREQKERLPGGYWKIDAIYKVLTNIYSTDSKKEITDEMWKDRINLLKQWKETSPNSITARIALAESSANYGWFVRGNGFAGTVSDEAALFLHEQFNIAEHELSEADKLAEKCPRGYRTMLWIAMINGWSSDKYDVLFEEAVKSEPNYIQFYILKSDRVSPKWRGEKGEWLGFMESLPNKSADLNSSESDMIYFILAANKTTDSSVANDWVTLSKERVRKGFDELEEKYGLDSYRLNQYAQFSCRRNDIIPCKETLARIDDNDWNSKVWSKPEFDMMKQYALLAYDAQEKNKPLISSKSKTQ
jgi:hypothetical protein